MGTVLHICDGGPSEGYVQMKHGCTQAELARRELVRMEFLRARNSAGGLLAGGQMMGEEDKSRWPWKMSRRKRKRVDWEQAVRS